MGLPKLTETSTRYWKEAWMEVVKKLMGGPHVD